MASGKEFEIVDSYVDPSSAHRMLDHDWVGTSEFREDEINVKDNPSMAPAGALRKVVFRYLSACKRMSVTGPSGSRTR